MLVILVLMLIGAGSTVRAQGAAETVIANRHTLEARLFEGIYRIEAAPFQRVMRGADATAWPLFIGGPATAWTGVWVFRHDGDWADAYRLTLSEIGALGATMGLKYLARRTRPYVRFDDIDSRKGDIARKDPYSFPSGHAAISFVMATSWTLSHPRWYVAVPGYLWATSVSVSRVWLGVHYPSDVLVGALLGTAVAWGIHELGSRIIPTALQKDDPRPGRSLILLRLRL